jgi:hypothetical protein
MLPRQKALTLQQQQDNTYKVAADKAARIICCLTPLRSLVYCPSALDGRKFADQFKKAGFNVLYSTDVKRIQQQWVDSSTPLIVVGHFPTIDANLFTGVYSFIFLYPNQQSAWQTYALKIEASPMVDIIKENIIAYNKFREFFDDKMLVVLL